MPKITGTPEDREQIRELYARYAIYVDNERFRRLVQCSRPYAVCLTADVRETGWSR